MKPAPRGTSNIGPEFPFNTYEFCQLPVPGIVWCGDYEKWTGEPRECGSCPAPPAVLLMLAGIDKEIAATKLTIDSLNAKGVEGEEQESEMDSLDEKLIDLKLQREKVMEEAKEGEKDA